MDSVVNGSQIMKKLNTSKFSDKTYSLFFASEFKISISM